MADTKFSALPSDSVVGTEIIPMIKSGNPSRTTPQAIADLNNTANRSRSNHTGTQTLSTISDAGSAATKNAPSSGNAAVAEVVLGSDTRLTDARAPTTHSHPQSDITNLSTDLVNKSNVGHSHTSSDVSDFNEAVQDQIGSKVIGGSNVTVSYNDTTGETTVSATGGGGGSATVNQATIDFGSTEKSDEVFNVTDANISAASKIVAFITWISSLGRDPDEIMADPISISIEPKSGSMDVYASALQGTVSGKYAINYLIG